MSVDVNNTYNWLANGAKRQTPLSLDPLPRDSVVNGNRLDQNNQDNYKEHWLKNRDTIKIAGYLAALVTYIVMFNIRSLPTLPYPIVGNLLDWDPNVLPVVWYNGAVLVLLLWGIMYCCKMLIVVFKHKCCLQKYGGNEASNPEPSATPLCRTAVPVVCYQAFFGFWIGWATNVHVTYMTSEPEYLATGVFLFILGQGVFIVCSTLRILRGDSKTSGYLIELSEMIILLGFAITAFTLSGFTMFVFRVVLILMSLKGVVDITLF